jgi:large subunit ribosomal protein L31e
MAENIERIYNIPLRKEWLKEPRSRRSNRALMTVKDFVKKHTKAGEIKISKGVSDFVFSRGFKKPPGAIKVEVQGDFTKVLVKIPGEVIIKKEEKKKTGIAGLKEKLTGKPEEEKKEETPKEEERPKEAEEKIEKEAKGKEEKK